MPTTEQRKRRDNCCCVNSIAQLKVLPHGLFPCVTVLGYHDPGDRGGGVFYWDPASTDPDNGGTIIVPASKPSPGRWRRMVEGPLSVGWFGAKGDGTADDTAAIQAAIAAAHSNISGTTANLGPSVVLFPKGLYKVTSPFTLSKAVTLIGEGIPAGGVLDLPNASSTILHDFAGDLFTFDGSDPGGNRVVSGGGVERLRIVQTHAGANPGSAIVIKAKSGSPTQPAWTKLRLLVIEQAASASSWDWGIQIDGSASEDGILNLFIGEVAMHISAGNGALEVKCGSGCLIYDCQFHLNGVVSITGTPALSSLSVVLVNVNCSTLNLDFAGDISVTGGYYRTMTSTSNTSGQTLLLPGRINETFADGSARACALMHYDIDFGTFRFTRPILLNNSQWLYGLNAAGADVVNLFGLDSIDAARLVPKGDAMLMVGQTPGGIGPSAKAPDIILGVDNNSGSYHHGVIRALNNARTNANSILGTDASDRMELGMEASGIKWGTPLVPLGTSSNATLGKVGGSGPGNSAQNSWMQAVDSTGATFWVPVWK